VHFRNAPGTDIGRAPRHISINPRLEAGWRALAEKALREVSEVPDLSSDTRHIVTRTGAASPL